MARETVHADARRAPAGLLFEGMTVRAGGFGPAGDPACLIPAPKDSAGIAGRQEA